MENWLRVTNPSSEELSVTLVVNGSTGAFEQVLELAPQASTNLPLHQPTYGTRVDSYGVVTLTAKEHTNLFSELLRVRHFEDEVDFAIPTTVR